jgi:hypothetical protein
LCTRGDIITRADLAVERWPAWRAEASCDAADELVLVSRGSGAQIVELVRPIAARPVARRALGGEPSGGLDDAVAIEHTIEHTVEHAVGRARAQPRR